MPTDSYYQAWIWSQTVHSIGKSMIFPKLIDITKTVQPEQSGIFPKNIRDPRSCLLGLPYTRQFAPIG